MAAMRRFSESAWLCRIEGFFDSSQHFRCVYNLLLEAGTKTMASLMHLFSELKVETETCGGLATAVQVEFGMPCCPSYE